MLQKTYTVPQILRMLESCEFEEWYNDKFTDVVTGEVDVSRPELIKDIEGMLF